MFREEFCPAMSKAYCDCPFYLPECDDAWNCEDIYGISMEMMNYYDTNYDG